jgi:hypothetical protein
MPTIPALLDEKEHNSVRNKGSGTNVTLNNTLIDVPCIHRTMVGLNFIYFLFI